MTDKIKPLFPKSMAPGESVYSVGKLKCGFNYEVVGMPAHHYRLLIEGVCVWNMGGHVSAADAEKVTELWADHKYATLTKLEDVLANDVGRCYVGVREAQARLNDTMALCENLEKLRHDEG